MKPLWGVAQDTCGGASQSGRTFLSLPCFYTPSLRGLCPLKGKSPRSVFELKLQLSIKRPLKIIYKPLEIQEKLTGLGNWALQQYLSKYFDSLFQGLCEYSMATKHKRAGYSVGEKLQIILRIRNGETQVKVSRELGTPEFTMQRWLKNDNTCYALSKHPVAYSQLGCSTIPQRK